MYKVGNILILVTDINTSNVWCLNKYTVNNKYKILFTKNTAYYLENDDTTKVLELLNNDTVSTFGEKQIILRKRMLSLV